MVKCTLVHWVGLYSRVGLNSRRYGMPTGGSGESTGPEEPVEFEFLGLRCDHQVLKHLETKNLSNFGIFDEIWLFLGGLLLLAFSNPHGCNRDLEI